MSKKRIVITSKGLQLDMDALKASQPKAKPIITGKKEKSIKSTPKNITPVQNSTRINATFPTQRPDQSQIVTQTLPVVTVPTVAPVKEEVELIVEEVVLVEEGHKNHVKKSKE